MAASVRSGSTSDAGPSFSSPSTASLPAKRIDLYSHAAEDAPARTESWAAISQKLDAISAFRSTHKQHTVREQLRASITEERTLRPMLGHKTYFEVGFHNPYKSDHCFTVHVQRALTETATQEIQLVTSLEEWKKLCVEEGHPVPHAGCPVGNAVYAKGHAQVRLPFKFKSFALPAERSEERVVYRIVVKCGSGEDVRQVLINVQPQPVVVHQSFRIFCASEQPLVRWLFVDTLPPKKTNPQQAHELGIQIGEPEAGSHATKWIVSNNKHMKLASFIHRIDCGGQRVEHHEYVELRMPGNQLKGTLSCYLLLYSDSFMHQVWEVWHLEMVCCHHKIVNAQVGCTNQILLPLHVMWNDIPQKEEPLQLACAASHPDFQLVEVQECGNLQVAYHPKLPSHSVFYVNTVDQVRNSALSTFLVEIRANYPAPTRRWSETIPPPGRSSVVRRIPFSNLYYNRKTFSVFTTSPQYLKLYPTRFALDPDQSEPLIFTFSGLNLPGRWQFYVFVNTADDDQTEECLEINLTVLNMRAVMSGQGQRSGHQ
uniref:NPHP4 Ig-like domain-containing protein n=1 Tax=Eutreptiella gymnastica TaxID=73025 RepID=A0A7S4FIP8_9EUGL